ncbi:MAG TPA: PIN domain-containing protein, partial [Xanthobacteraceae bacterium]
IRMGDEAICTSIIVAAELRYGAVRKAAPRLAEKIEKALRKIQVLPLQPPVDLVYAEIRAELERAGMMIGANDLFIASHARMLGHVLVTDNEREFSRVPDLRIENWLR